jgi:uncharacterized protein YbdZ (MbtH family)
MRLPAGFKYNGWQDHQETALNLIKQQFADMAKI